MVELDRWVLTDDDGDYIKVQSEVDAAYVLTSSAGIYVTEDKAPDLALAILERAGANAIVTSMEIPKVEELANGMLKTDGYSSRPKDVAELQQWVLRDLALYYHLLEKEKKLSIERDAKFKERWAELEKLDKAVLIEGVIEAEERVAELEGTAKS